MDASSLRTVKRFVDVPTPMKPSTPPQVSEIEEPKGDSRAKGILRRGSRKVRDEEIPQGLGMFDDLPEEKVKKSKGKADKIVAVEDAVVSATAKKEKKLAVVESMGPVIAPLPGAVERVPSEAEGEIDQKWAAAHNKGTLFDKIFRRPSQRRLREEMLFAELRDLRASYAGLLQTTKELRAGAKKQKATHETVNRALSPFPEAVKGLKDVSARQEEAGEILINLREKLRQSEKQDERLYTSVDRVATGVSGLEGSVSKVNDTVLGIATQQKGAATSLENLGKKLARGFDDAATVARQNAERIEQANDDVLDVLRQMEKNSQRGLWIFASLLAVLFVALICFSAKVSGMAVEGEGQERTPAARESGSEATTLETVSISFFDEPVVEESSLNSSSEQLDF